MAVIEKLRKIFFGGIQIGSAGSALALVKKGTIAIDPANLATVTRGSTTFTLTGARAGDLIVMAPPAALNDDLVYCGAAVTADDTVSIYYYNPTGGGINDTERTWGYVWMKFAA